MLEKHELTCYSKTQSAHVLTEVFNLNLHLRASKPTALDQRRLPTIMCAPPKTM